MRWIDNFDLFLFDLDGLLVNSEILHYQAYKKMLEKRGFLLDWSFEKFCEIAHYSHDCLQKEIFMKFPKLEKIQPDWNLLRDEKNLIYLDMLSNGCEMQLLPGVEKLLLELERKNIKRCVVTNSNKEMVMLIKKCQKCLQTIPNWVTREDYKHPKPYPDGYLHAIKLFGKKGDKIIGFEDSRRGIISLIRANVCPVLINPSENSCKEEKIFHFSSFENILDNFKG